MAGLRESIYPLADPCEVDVPAIERELESLWRDAAKGGATESVTRAAAFNLIYVAMASDDRAANLLARLTLEHPSRCILLGIGDPTAPPAQSAWVTAYCHQPAPNAPQICSEFISLEVSGNAIRLVGSTLLSLMLPGLPIVLAWDAGVSAVHPLLAKLGHSCNRVITDMIDDHAPAVTLREFFALQHLLGRDVISSDLGWTRLNARRFAFARWFERESAPRIQALRWSERHIQVADFLFVMWIEAMLHRSGVHPRVDTRTDSAPLLLLEDGRTIPLSPPAAPEEKLDVISDELKVWSRDGVMESTLNLARARLG
jgi:glucose-6-phosphate dehydrogenase assembly protein OpcA